MSNFKDTNKIFKIIEGKINKRLQDWGLPIGGDMFSRDNPEEEDVPYATDTNPYITHKNFPSENDDLREQDEEEDPENIPPEEAPPEENPEVAQQEAPPEEAPPDPSAGGDPNAMAGGDPSMGGDPNAMGGMPGQEEKVTDPKELGRVYELKKIYARLISIDAYISTSTIPEVLIIKKYVAQAVEMFKTLSSNITMYKDKIDDIIQMFYKFLKTVYIILSKYYKTHKNDETEII